MILVSRSLMLTGCTGLVLLGWLACSTAPAQQASSTAPIPAPTLAALREGFLHPPAEARLRCYWWWLNGNTDAATITHDLEEMRAKGIGGALLVDANGADQNGNRPVPAGPTFGSPAWVALFTHALAEADRLGLEITLNITSGWNLGGPDVKPEQASKLLTYARAQIEGGSPVSLTLPTPETHNGFYRQIAVLAYPLSHGAALAAQPKDEQGDRITAPKEGASGLSLSWPSAEQRAAEKQAAATLRLRAAAAETGFSMPDASAMLKETVEGEAAGFADTALASVRDVSAQMSAEGVLTWSAPPGEWEVLRIGYTDSDARVSTASGAWQGLAIDYLSRDAFLQYWAHTVEPLLSAAKPYRSLRYFATDSWELKGTNWTGDFRQQFQRLRGYDPVPYLPVVAGRIVGNRAQSTRFLTDLRRTVADLVVTQHYDVFAEKAREHGMGTQAESGGPHGAPIDALETFRRAAIVQSEFWSQNPHRAADNDRFFTKEAASAANIYGQRFVAQEGETSIGPQWSESLATDLKPSFDMGITEGMNRIVWHEFTSSPASTGLPGQEYFAGTHLNPKVTWWDAGGPFFTYLNRAQFVMQQGVAVDDVLYFYGDNVPNFVRLKADDPAQVLPGYDYDVTDEDALLHSIRTEDDRLTGPGGMAWKLLALPKTGRVSLDVLRRVEAYVRAGGVVVGMPPQSTTGLVTQETIVAFGALVRGIWGPACAPGSHHAYGKGQVFCTSSSREALSVLGIPPDVEVAGGSSLPIATSASEFDYIHRRVGGTDLYFVRNGSERTSQHQVIFRADGRNPELWDAVTAETGIIPPHITLPDGRVQISLTLSPFGSMFVVFPETQSSKPTANAQTPFHILPTVTLSPWRVSFPPVCGAPATLITVSTLKSWTEWPDPGAQFFSGTATYRATVMAPSASEGSEVWLRFADVREIARVKVNGKEAGTIWAKPSRVRVDSLLVAGENTLEIAVTNLWPNRIIGDLQPGTTQRCTATNITGYRADSPLLPSGLLGPATWEIRDRSKAP